MGTWATDPLSESRWGPPVVTTPLPVSPKLFRHAPMFTPRLRKLPELRWWKAGVRDVCLGLASLLPVLGTPASGQIDQFVPEIDLNYKLARDVRVRFQAKETREGGDPVQAEIGPSIDFYLRPLISLKKIARRDIDDSKPRPVVFSIGYRYLNAPSTPETHRLEPVITAHFPMKSGFLLSDRNRADLDWKSATFSWRYRNLFQVERRLTIRSYHPAPYASVEFFYQNQYNKWSDTAIYAGCLFPMGRHIELNPYYEHQNNTGKAPNRQLNQLGLILNTFF